MCAGQCNKTCVACWKQLGIVRHTSWLQHLCPRMRPGGNDLPPMLRLLPRVSCYLLFTIPSFQPASVSSAAAKKVEKWQKKLEAVQQELPEVCCWQARSCIRLKCSGGFMKRARFVRHLLAWPGTGRGCLVHCCHNQTRRCSGTCSGLDWPTCGGLCSVFHRACCALLRLPCRICGAR